MKNCPIPLAKREMRIKVTMKFHLVKMTIYPKDKETQTLVRMWRQGNSHLLLVWMWIRPKTVENSMEISLKTCKRLVTRSINPTTGYIATWHELYCTAKISAPPYLMQHCSQKLKFRINQGIHHQMNEQRKYGIHIIHTNTHNGILFRYKNNILLLIYKFYILGKKDSINCSKWLWMDEITPCLIS